MNTKIPVFAILVPAILCGLFCAGQSNVVFYGTNVSSIGVYFVDTNLSSLVKSAIVSDLQLCLQEWGKNGVLRLRNKGESVGYLDNPDRNPCYPDALLFPENVVSNGSVGLALQIPTALSEAYTNAIAFAAANSNIVASAYEFVAFVSSSNFTAISSSSLPNYLIQKGVTTNEIIADAQATISELRHQTFYPPSILGFQYSDRGPSATNLWMRIPCSINLSYTAGKGWHFFSAVWHDGKWKFCVWQD